MEWIGISYFDFLYHENYIERNNIIEMEDTQFDFILYINDDDCKWGKRYGHLANANITLNLKDAFDVDNLSIMEVWNQVGAYCNRYGIFPSVFSELFNVYRECDLFYAIFSKMTTYIEK